MAGNISLSHLQDFIKRDPQSYKDEFLTCYNYLQQLNQSKDLDDYVLFVGQVVHLYPTRVGEFVSFLINQLKENSRTMESDRRIAFCRALIMMRHKSLIPPVSVLELFFRLFRCPDKRLRKMLFAYIVNDVKSVNLVHKNMKLNSRLQNFMFTMIEDSNIIAAKKSLEVMIALYKKNIWRDSKTVNAIASACFRKETKLLVTAVRFFIGGDENEDDDDSDDEKEKDKMSDRAEQLRQMKLAHRVGKKSKKRLKRLQRAMDNVRKKSKNAAKMNKFMMPAVHLVYDPQDFTERLLKVLQTSSERFEIQLLMMDAISRFIGMHRLQILGFYTHLQKYLKPRQMEVTKILLFAAQASHTEVPPDWLEPIIQEIADNFVTERVSAEGQAVGLNAIREIVARCPFAVDRDMVALLTSHRSGTRNANVIAAIQGLLGILRRENPAVLSKKDRGRPTRMISDSLELGERQFGESRPQTVIEGADILKSTDEIVEEKAATDAWESCSEDSDNSGGEWFDVSHSSDEGEPADTELTGEDAKKKAEEILTSRILSQEEFETIRREQLKRQTTVARRKKSSKKVKVETKEKNEDLVSLSAIEQLAKKSKSSKEERINSILSGREDRQKYGYKVSRMNTQASTTNREKRKQKPFDMVKHKIKGKSKKSFRDKQLALRNRLRKMCRK